MMFLFFLSPHFLSIFILLFRRISSFFRRIRHPRTTHPTRKNAFPNGPVFTTNFYYYYYYGCYKLRAHYIRRTSQYNIKKKEEAPEAETQKEPDNPLMRKKKTPEELAKEAEEADQDELTSKYKYIQ